MRGRVFEGREERSDENTTTPSFERIGRTYHTRVGTCDPHWPHAFTIGELMASTLPLSRRQFKWIRR
jgi:hypothetical protein